MYSYESLDSLKKHEEKCLSNSPVTIKMPSEEKNILKFRNYLYKIRNPVVVYGDFETINVPIHTSSPNPQSSYQENKTHQQAISYCLYIKSDSPNLFESGYYTYFGKDCVKIFVDRVLNIEKEISRKLYKYTTAPLKTKATHEEINSHCNATHCYLCGFTF